MNISLIIVILYIVALFAISWVAKRRSDSDSAAYALASRKLGWPYIAVNIIGLAVGGASTIGVSQHAFRVGLSAGWYTAAWGVGAIVMGLLMARAYRRSNITTITELIEQHHTKGAVILGVIGQIIIQLVIISLQYIAGGAILHAILPDIFDLQTGMFVSAVVFIGITCIGGMWSASLSNVMNIILIYIGTIIATAIQFDKVGGTAGLATQLPADVPWFSLIDGVGVPTIVSWCATLVTVNIALQSILQIAMSAKDEGTASKGLVIGGIVMFPVGLLAAFLGVCARAAYPTVDAALALPEVIMSLTPLLAGITLAALWAADVSTACNLLLSAGTLFARDIYKRFINPDCSEQRQVNVMRWCVLIAGLVTYGAALSIRSILGTIMIGLALCAAFGVIVIVGLFAPKFVCPKAGFWTLLVGILVLFAWVLVPATHVVPGPVYMVWICCIATYALCYALFGTKQ